MSTIMIQHQSEYATLKLEMAANEIQNCYNHISRQDSEAKKYISLIIVYVMTSEEVAGTLSKRNSKTDEIDCIFKSNTKYRL